MWSSTTSKAPAGLYRNDTIAPRVAVRLSGLPPNTQGIGAKVRLLDGALPMQSQEVFSGGRYMSGSDTMLVFAAGRLTGGMTLEVTWRSGRRSRITGVKPNRLYEINESGASPPRRGRPRGVRSALCSTMSVSSSTHASRRAFRRFRSPAAAAPAPESTGARRELVRPRWRWLGGPDRGQRSRWSLACYRNDPQGSFQLLQTGPPLDTVVSRDQTTVLGWRRAGRRPSVCSPAPPTTKTAWPPGAACASIDLGRRGWTTVARRPGQRWTAGVGRHGWRWRPGTVRGRARGSRPVSRAGVLAALSVRRRPVPVRTRPTTEAGASWPGQRRGLQRLEWRWLARADSRLRMGRGEGLSATTAAV